MFARLTFKTGSAMCCPNCGYYILENFIWRDDCGNVLVARCVVCGLVD